MLVSLRVVSAYILISLLSACHEPGLKDAVTGDRPECPDHEFHPRGVKGEQLPPVMIDLVDAATNIPEFNDCQALVAGHTYGPVVAIFAQQTAWPKVPAPDRWYLVAVIYNFGTSTDPSASYRPLLIKPGYSCLYLPLANSGTIAAYLQYNEQDLSCQPSIAKPKSSNLAASIRDKLVQTDAVPHAARWDWDQVDSVQYMGVACGNQWCEVGRRGFHSAADPSTDWVSSVPGLEASAAHRIRGYFDEQELAVPNPGGDSLTRPLLLSGVRATFFAAPDSGTSTAGRFDRLQYVGTMMVTAEHPKYQARFGLVPGEPTHIYLKRKLDQTGRPLRLNPDRTEQYEAIFVTGRNRIVFQIKRRAHDKMDIPPIVRWRWIWTDETTWIRCLEGCCSTQ
jgi:hypothetical protein